MVWEGENFKAVLSHFIFIFGNKQYFIVPFFYTHILPTWSSFDIFKEFSLLPLMPFCKLDLFYLMFFDLPPEALQQQSFTWLLQATEVKDEIELCFQAWGTKIKKNLIYFD